MTLIPLLYVLELILLPKAAHASEPEKRLDVAVGLSSPYNFEEEDLAAIDGLMVRGGALARSGLWLGDFEGYGLFLQRVDAWMAHGALGYGLPERPWLPPAWLVASWLSVSRLPYPALAGNEQRNAPGFGAVMLFDLDRLANGEARFAIDWFPTVGTIYESMYVGWSVGPVGFRVGGFGLRVTGGRQLTGFTLDLAHTLR